MLSRTTTISGGGGCKDLRLRVRQALRVFVHEGARGRARNDTMRRLLRRKAKRGTTLRNAAKCETIYICDG